MTPKQKHINIPTRVLQAFEELLNDCRLMLTRESPSTLHFNYAIVMDALAAYKKKLENENGRISCKRLPRGTGRTTV